MTSKVQGWCDVNWARDLDFHIYQDLDIFSSKVEVLYHSKVKIKLVSFSSIDESVYCYI
jgi:hypothetical protein